ncbi:MAG TPA: hypothetical protein VFQ61_32975 [Polyangiaceae bacterium]|nr:hypothetical protein [Polyangiaceae bacterium]
MRAPEPVVELVRQRMVRVQALVLEYAEKLTLEDALLDTEDGAEGESTPAQPQGARDLAAGVAENLAQFGPIVDRLELELFHGRAGQD